MRHRPATKPMLPHRPNDSTAESASLERISARERAYVNQVLDSGFRSSAGHVMASRLEAAFACELGVKHAVSFINGTATMHACLTAAGIGPGDEVIVPPLTMASTTLAVLHAGAVPVYADIDAETLQIDPASIAARCTRWTKAVIPVALYGLAPDLNAIMQIARERRLLVLEDAAQAVGARYCGRAVGSFGDASSFSFQSSKHLTGGEGGMLAMNDPDLAVRSRRVQSLGYATVGAESGAITKQDIQDPDYSRHLAYGYNFRMPELCAAVALAQVERSAVLVQRRMDVGQLFLEAISGSESLKPQQVSANRLHSYWAFTAQLTDEAIGWHDCRDQFLAEGGDPFYGAWKLTYLEPFFDGGPPVPYRDYYGEPQSYEAGLCPVAERVQPRLLQLKTNYWDWDSAQEQAEALARTVAVVG